MSSLNQQFRIFEDLMEANDLWNANMVIKNMFNKNIGNVEVFKTFFDFNMKIANWDIDLPTRMSFLEQAEMAVVFFSENVEITYEVIELIKGAKEELQQTIEALHQIKQRQDKENNLQINNENHQLLKELVEYKLQILQCKKQEEFEGILVKVQEIEAVLREDLLTEEQQRLYSDLTKEYTSLINEKLKELEKISNQEYNQRAVEDFHFVLTQFKDNEGLYKDSHYELGRLAKRLFGYDSSRLFNEALIYYNHVYSNLFSKLDEAGKLRLTELAIKAEKNLSAGGY